MPPTPAPAPPKRRRTTLWIAVGAVVVVVIVVLGLGLVGILPIFSSGSSSPAVLSYSQALPLANGAAQGMSGGSWVLILSAGLVTPIATSGSNTFSGGSGCEVTPVPGAPTNVTLAAGPSNPTGGTAPNWLFMYRNAAEELLIVGVLNGKATAFDTIAAGQSCSTVFGLFSVMPSNVLDSTAIANDVASAAASYLSANPNITATYSLFGGASVLGIAKLSAEWLVNYTTCPFSPATGTTGTAFNATLNATTGAVIYDHTSAKVACATHSSLGLVRESAPRMVREPASSPERSMRSG